MQQWHLCGFLHGAVMNSLCACHRVVSRARWEQLWQSHSSAQENQMSEAILLLLYTAVEENNMHRKDRKAIDFTVLTQERRMLKPRWYCSDWKPLKISLYWKTRKQCHNNLKPQSIKTNIILHYSTTKMKALSHDSFICRPKAAGAKFIGMLDSINKLW